MPVSLTVCKRTVLSLSSVLYLFSTVLTQAAPASFNGAAAYGYSRKATAFGERPSGSEAISHLRDWIVSQLKPLGGKVTLDPFTGYTPTGAVPMVNIVVRFPGTSGKAIAVTGHYDTKRMPMVHFVGANDGGSSTGFLIEFARVISETKHSDDVYLVFFDGEEDVINWTPTDSRYGSRDLAAKWGRDGTLQRLKALINIDMIGDKDLDIANDSNSSMELRDELFAAAAKTGNAKYFRHDLAGIDDDHKPFGDMGVSVLDVIDLDYGPNNSYWHTAADTMDKLSIHSFQVVGDVVMELVAKLES